MPLVNHLRRALQNVLALPPVTALAVMRAKAFANKAACGRGATALLDHCPAVPDGGRELTDGVPICLHMRPGTASGV